MAGVSLRIKVYSQFQTYFDGPAEVISARSRIGDFDVLQGHANFFTLLVAGDIVIFDGKNTTNIPVSQGILQVADDVVKVFVDI